MTNPNPFKTTGGIRYLKALFYETSGADKDTVMYTLKDQDHCEYPSLYRLYMSLEDWTEYTFASTYLDSWEHWEMLCQCNWFKPYVQRWRKELELKLKARLLNVLVQDSVDTTSKTCTSSAKYLLDSGWAKDKSPAKRGRPTKDEIASEAQRMAMTESRLSDDYNRIFNKDVN